MRCREPRVAAETFAEIRWGDDYPQEQRVCVRDDHGVVHRFVARVEMVPAFTVRPAEESERG
ncbi:hypothetical protein [Sorangium sp. So ce388]|uniref:hypothetical protein n=1 Tax=Sorangium sp. So ce388 TaxID=3133309 RepID=UPI003F5C5330